jgi:DNA-binding transcriptional MerR regulator
MSERQFMMVRMQREPAVTVYVSATELAKCCEVHLELIARLVVWGLLDPVGKTANDEWVFDAGAIPLLRKILRLRDDLGINFSGIGVVLELLARMEAMEKRIGELEKMLLP